MAAAERQLACAVLGMQTEGARAAEWQQAAQSYVHYLEIELHERDELLEASQAQAADLPHEVEHLQELIRSKSEEPEEDPEEIEGMSGVEDN
jgi:hypothetical protein